MLLETREKYTNKQHKSMLVQHKPIPPSIPMKKMPPNSHTGRGVDMPGPANYNPNHEFIKTKNRTSDFSKRQKSREIFSNKGADLPGPGNYEYRDDIGTKSGNPLNQTGQSPMFLSKVPNCKDTKDDNGIPGPGSYIDKKKKTKNLHTRSNSYRIDPNGRGFMTGTKREGFWDNTLEAPFTKGTNITDVPGPDKYQNSKKRNSQKSGFLSQQFVSKPGFSSSDTRE